MIFNKKYIKFIVFTSNMFVRKKKVKKNIYGYLVESKYTKKGSRQKVKKYLGRVFETENTFEEFNNETYSGLLREFFDSLDLPINVCLDYKSGNV